MNLQDAFVYKKKRYLVFEYVNHTLLDELQRSARGLAEDVIRKYLWQILIAVEFCHANDVRSIIMYIVLLSCVTSVFYSAFR